MGFSELLTGLRIQICISTVSRLDWAESERCASVNRDDGDVLVSCRLTFQIHAVPCSSLPQVPAEFGSTHAFFGFLSRFGVLSGPFRSPAVADLNFLLLSRRQKK